MPDYSPPSESRSYSRRLKANLERAKARRAEEAENAPRPKTADDDSFTGRLRENLSKAAPADAPTTPAPSENAQETPEPTGPVGTGDYLVRPGDCIASIACDAGHLWNTLWDDPANAELREARKDPNVLLPEDRVTVPPLREKQEPGASEQGHRFVKKGQPEMFRVRVLSDGEPRKNEPYTLTVDDESEYEGTTDPEGHLQAAIRPNARRVIVEIGKDDPRDRFEFALGAIDPISELSGVQARLTNLGFDCGPATGACPRINSYSAGWEPLRAMGPWYRLGSTSPQEPRQPRAGQAAEPDRRGTLRIRVALVPSGGMRSVHASQLAASIEDWSENTARAPINSSPKVTRPTTEPVKSAT